MANETEQETTPAETTPAADTPLPKTPEEQPISVVDRANEAAERLERANKVRESQLAREEKLAVQRKLGGRSEVTENETEDDKVKKAARALLPDGMDCPGVTD